MTLRQKENTIMEFKNMIDSELENVTGGIASQNKFYTVKEGDCLRFFDFSDNIPS